MACGREICSALLTRSLFVAHALMSVGLSHSHEGNLNLWFLMLLLAVLLLIETIAVIYKRKGQEYMYFWPSCFLYLSAMLPVIWIMELDRLHHRLKKQDKLESKLQGTSNSPFQINGFDIKAVFDSDVTAKTVSELGLIVVIIIGRWLLPRGQLTRDQLSALLLGYIGTGADILDMFNSISSEKIAYNINMHYVILTMFSWSMLQFCITATVSAGSEIMGPATSGDIELGQNVTEERPSATERRSLIRSSSKQSLLSSNESNKCCNCDADLLQIFVPLLMQDGPFLVLRILLWAKYDVNDEVHVYFTGKNALTLALLLYRFYCLKVKDHPVEGGTGVREIGLENQAIQKTDNEEESGEEIEGDNGERYSERREK